MLGASFDELPFGWDNEFPELSTEVGDFTVKLRQNARYIEMDKCTACGDCVDACPLHLLPTRLARLAGRGGHGGQDQGQHQRQERFRLRHDRRIITAPSTDAAQPRANHISRAPTTAAATTSEAPPSTETTATTIPMPTNTPNNCASGSRMAQVSVALS